MPKEVRHQLTSARVLREKRPGYHCDGAGLYLAVTEHGSRSWVFRTTVHGKRREFGLGSAYIVGLADARKLAADMRVAAKSGGDPRAVRDTGRRQTITFEDAARRVWKEQIEPHARNARHRTQWLVSLVTYAFPLIGGKPVDVIEQRDVLALLAPIWTEKPETARRVRQRVRTVLDWARAAGYRDGVNPVEGVEKGLPRQRPAGDNHLAASLKSRCRRLCGGSGLWAAWGRWRSGLRS